MGLAQPGVLQGPLHAAVHVDDLDIVAAAKRDQLVEDVDAIWLERGEAPLGLTEVPGEPVVRQGISRHQAVVEGAHFFPAMDLGILPCSLRLLAGILIDLKAILDRGDDLQIPAQLVVMPEGDQFLDGRFRVETGSEVK